MGWLGSLPGSCAVTFTAHLVTSATRLKKTKVRPVCHGYTETLLVPSLVAVTVFVAEMTAQCALLAPGWPCGPVGPAGPCGPVAPVAPGEPSLASRDQFGLARHGLSST